MTRRRRLWWAVGLVLAALVVLAAAVLVAGGLALRSETGSARLLSWVPGLKVIEPRGAVWGDFSARRAELALPNGSSLTLIEPRWRGVRWLRNAGASWGWSLHLDRLEAEQAELLWIAGPKTAPSGPPTRLSLPMGLRVNALAVRRFHSNVTGTAPILDIQGALALQEPDATGQPAHRVRLEGLRWQSWRLRGDARVGTRGALPVTGTLDARTDAPARVEVGVALQGPLTRLAAAVRARVGSLDGMAEAAGDAGAPNPADAAVALQSLSADLQLAPFAAWPLPRALISARGLDIQALWRAGPSTALSGQIEIVPREVLGGSPGHQAAAPGKAAAVSDLLVRGDVRNDRPGAWDAGRLPVSFARLAATLPAQASTQAAGSLARRGSVDGVLGLAARGARAPGTVQVSGRWDLAERQATALALTVTGADLQALHGTAPAMALQGRIDVNGQADQSWLVKGRLNGRDNGARVLREAVDAVLAARWLPGDLTLETLKLTAGAAQAQASGRWRSSAPLAGPADANGTGSSAGRQGERAPPPAQPAPWHVEGQVDLASFDPAVWLPWPRPPGDAIQRTRLNGRVSGALSVPGRLEGAQGTLEARLSDSLLLGVPVKASVSGRQQPQGGAAEGRAVVQAEGTVSAGGSQAAVALSWPWRAAPSPDASSPNAPATPDVGTADRPRPRAPAPFVLPGTRLKVDLDAPSLAALQPWAQALGWQGVVGRLSTQAELERTAQGAWATSGDLSAEGVRATTATGGVLALSETAARWSMAIGSRPDPSRPLLLQASVGRGQWGAWGVQQWRADLQGTVGEHGLSVQGRVDLPERKLSSGAVVRESASVDVASRGGWSGALAGDGPRAWRARVETLRVQPVKPGAAASGLAGGAPWLQAQPFELAWREDGAGSTFSVSPTRAELFGAGLTVRQVLWARRAGQAARTQLDLALEPLKLAEVLARVQPQAGWGGDLTLIGRVQAQQVEGAPWQVDAELARQQGDLSLLEPGIDGGAAQRLGMRQLRLTLQARDGVWTAAQQVEARVLGTIQGQQVVQGRDPTALPGPADTLRGQLEVRASNLRTFGVWAPAGWRFSGQALAHARLAGTLGEPQYEGEVTGRDIGVSNILQGVHITDGVLDLRLKGDQARLEGFTARGGEQGGTVSLTGDAVLGASPTAALQLTVQRFALLQRVDRRAVVSGQLQLGLSAQALIAEGQVVVDEGLVDISQSEAPTVGDDVNVVNRPGAPPQEAGDVDGNGNGATAAQRKLQVSLAVDLGSNLRLRGRGLDTRLKGALRLTTPNGRPTINGTISTVDGTYAAYGQRLVIARGELAFTGPVDNPRLDIQAMRPQSPLAAASDVKVGVLITGTAQDPRVRLYSEPSMSETEKLSWLVLGRGPAGLGGADIGLLQTAAAALLGGEGGSPQDNLISAIGLDELSVRQTDGAVRDTIVTVGKQLSERWYLGYERSVTATEGTWQLIYRLAQRITVRLQGGEDNAIDIIRTWRWD